MFLFLSVTCPGLLIKIIGSALIQDTNVLYYPMFDKDQTCEWSKISVETLQYLNTKYTL